MIRICISINNILLLRIHLNIIQKRKMIVK